LKIDDHSEKIVLENALIRFGHYAMEKLSSGVWITKAINLVVKGKLIHRSDLACVVLTHKGAILGDILYICHFDREGLIHTSGLNYINDLPHFLALLFVLQRLSPEQWGFNRKLQPEYNGETATRDTILRLKVRRSTNGYTVESPPLLPPDTFTGPGGEQIPDDEYTVNMAKSYTYCQVLKGRATQTFPASDDEHPPDDKEPKLVIKFSWPEKSRQNEADVVRAAKEAGKDEKWIKDHLPELVFDCDFDWFSTSHIREDLRLPTKHCRVLRVLVVRGLRPLTSIPPAEMYKVFWECFFCMFFILAFCYPSPDRISQVTTSCGPRASIMEISASTT